MFFVFCFSIITINIFSQNGLNTSAFSAGFKMDKGNLTPIYDVKKKDKTIDKRGLTFGINMGMIKGNGYNAMNYNGDTVKNENSINYILKNTYHYNEIKHVLMKEISGCIQFRVICRMMLL
jgi:hypothetical protein